MKKLMLSLSLGMLMLASCGGGTKMTPVEYNDAIIGEQTKISKVMIRMADYFSIDIEESDKIRLELVQQCKSSVDVLKALPDYKGDETFRNAGIALFTFYKDISEKEYREMIDVLKKENIELADFDILSRLEKDIAEKEGPLDDAFQGAQQAFAKKHNLSLYDNEVQKEIDQLGR